MKYILWFVLSFMLPVLATASQASVKKVLPHFLDKEGRHSLSPSHYERDAYQAYLRDHPEERTALRFDVLCKAPRSPNLHFLVEMRGSKESEPTRLQAESPKLTHKGGREWYSITVPGEQYEQFGKMLAWKVTLFDGEKALAYQASFLWQASKPAAPK